MTCLVAGKKNLSKLCEDSFVVSEKKSTISEKLQKWTAYASEYQER